MICWGVIGPGTIATGFAEALRERGHPCHVYVHPRAAMTWDQEQSRLAKWLHALPKPVAVMTQIVQAQWPRTQ